MAIEIIPAHFSRLEQAVDEIAADGLFFIETRIEPDQLAPEPHVHAYSVAIYLLEGDLELYEPHIGRTYRLEAGTKAVVPAQTLHKERSSAGFRAAIGLSHDPATMDEAASPAAG